MDVVIVGETLEIAHVDVDVVTCSDFDIHHDLLALVQSTVDC